MNTDLSRERLVKLYKEIRGVSPPKGMLPYSEDWFMSWQPNMHSSLFINIYNYVTKNNGVEGIDALIKSYRLYVEHILQIFDTAQCLLQVVHRSCEG